jgi:uncharacterized OsmC-like protein
MTTEHTTTIKQAVSTRIDYLREHPEKIPTREKAAVARVNAGLQCEVCVDGNAALTTDMPAVLGGGGTAPTPGWFMRAALASCDATTIAMRAACMGVMLESIEVTVESQSDARGILGMDDAMAGPAQFLTRIRIKAAHSDRARAHDVVDWALTHSPVADAMKRNVPNKVDLQID